MAGSQVSTSITIIDSLHGFMGLSLTEYSTSAAAAIAAGSVVEIAGAFFTFASDETINASSWTAITTATTAYIALTPSGTAGSQVVTAAYTATAPTWRDDLQGWYASAASSTRVIGTVYKAGATSYYPKYLYGSMQGGKQHTISANVASVASTFSVAGPISCESTISASGLLYGTGKATNGYFHGSGVTFGSIFSAMDSVVPVTGDSVIVSGSFSSTSASAGGYIVAARAERATATTISLYGYNLASDTLVAAAATSGSGTALNKISIAW